MPYLLDSAACIDAMRGMRPVVERLAATSPSDIAVSTVTWYELYTGVEKCKNPARERSKLEKLRANVHEVVFDLPASLVAARIRADLESRGEMIGPYDVLIAGQALSLNFVLVTANTNEFARVGGLVVENWQLAAT